MFLLGGWSDVAERTARRLTERYPGLEVVGTYAGSPNEAENDAIVARINDSRANVLLVAYGAPAQDKWIARNRETMPAVRVAMGVGGTFDFVVGEAKRAPRWLQRIGLEWLYRLVREPWRWRRQLALPRFVLALLADAGELAAEHGVPFNVFAYHRASLRAGVVELRSVLGGDEVGHVGERGEEGSFGFDERRLRQEGFASGEVCGRGLAMCAAEQLLGRRREGVDGQRGRRRGRRLVPLALAGLAGGLAEEAFGLPPEVGGHGETLLGFGVGRPDAERRAKGGHGLLGQRIGALEQCGATGVFAQREVFGLTQSQRMSFLRRSRHGQQQHSNDNQ